MKRLFVLMFLLMGCEKAIIQDPARDPVAVFESLWSAMDTGYAMFDYKQVDWQALHAQYRPMVTGSEEALFDVCSDMLWQLRDGHVSLVAGDRRFIYTGYYTGVPHNFDRDVVKKYLPEVQYQGVVGYAVVGEVGYLYIPTFGEGLVLQDVDVAMQRLRGSRRLIVDVRDNTGGSSDKVDHVTAAFLQERRLLKYDLYRDGDVKAKYVSPGDNVWADVPVYLLINKRCFSSCNDFALYLSELPNVVLVGDRTGGGSGTPYDYSLPNGWMLRYSASYATTPGGENIEDGIPPDHPVSNSMEDENNGRDAILQYTLKMNQVSR